MIGAESEDDPKASEEQDFGMSTCPNCDQAFMKKRGWQVFCSTACRLKSHQLEREAAVREYRMMKKQRGV